MKQKAPTPNSSVDNIFQLEGRVPLGKAIPFGLQHILAMFVANLTPITIIAAAAGLDVSMTAILLQNAMIAACIATMIQLYPIWKVGSGLPVVMGVSFTFVAVLSSVGAAYGYGTVVGAVLVGGIVEGCLGLCAKYWRKLITPVVAGCVVTGIGLSLFTVGIRSFGGGSNSVLWQQIKSDISWRKISTMRQAECASLGAAILAAVAIGIYPDLDTAAKVNTVARSCIPDPGNAEIYDGLYRRYLRVLEATKALYD